MWCKPRPVLTSFAFFCLVSVPWLSIHVQNLRFVSSVVPEILWGPKIWKVHLVTKGHAPFWTFFLFPLRSICMQNLKFVSSAVQEILGDPKIWKVGHVSKATSPFGNLKKNFFLFCIPYDQFECKIWSLYLQPFKRY